MYSRTLSGLVALLLASGASAQNCDIDGNGVCDTSDLNVILGCYGQQAVGACAPADLTGDGWVDSNDLTYWLGNCLGSPCGSVDLIAVSVDASALDERPTCEGLQANKQYLSLVGDVLVTIRNAGDRLSGSFHIAVFEDDNRDGQFQQPPIEEGYIVPVDPLAAGETRTLTVPFAYHFNQPVQGLPPREFFGSPITLRVNVTPEDNVVESNTSNNVVTSSAAIGGPDVVVSRIVPRYFRPDHQSPPTSVTFDARIGNAGSAPTPSPVVVRWYDGDPAQGAPQVAVAQIGPLDPGQWATAQFQNADTPPLVFQTSMWVAADPVAGEADTQNNHHNWSCLGDINFDNDISLDDLTVLLSNFGRTNVGYVDGDLNFDTLIDLSDLANMLGMFGQRCPSDCP